MKSKFIKLLAYAFFLLINNIIDRQALAQTVQITYPADRAVLRGLSSITGTATGPVNYVGISIIKNDSDEEWILDRRTGLRLPVYRWGTGPTGQWLNTTLNRGILPNNWTWSAPSGEYYLPNGSVNLPDGDYWIYAYAKTADGRRSQQVRRKFTIRR